MSKNIEIIHAFFLNISQKYKIDADLRAIYESQNQNLRIAIFPNHLLLIIISLS